MVYVGIDSGKQGAVAALRYGLTGVLESAHVYDAPVLGKVYDLLEMVRILRSEIVEDAGEQITFASLESVHSMPGQGVASMFSQGEGYGLWKMCLVAHGISHELPSPQRWKKYVLAGCAQKDKLAAYAVISRYAVQGSSLGSLCKGPRGALLDGRADALCLALYSRMISCGSTSVDGPL